MSAKARGRILAILFWLAAWQLASLLVSQEILLVSPLTVLATLAGLLPQGSFWSAVGFSTLRILGGLLLGMGAGILLAMASAASRAVRTLLDPLFSVLKSIPVASFIILVLIWSGSRNLSLAISFLMVLPVIYTGVLEGILQRDRSLLEMAEVFGVPRLRRLAAVDIPGVLPFFSSAAKVSLGLCWKSGVAAEVIGIPAGSIGERLYQAKIFLGTAELFAWTLVIVLASVLFEKLFLALLDRFSSFLAAEKEGRP